MAVIAYQYRGELVDQIHRGHIAVTDHTGRILWFDFSYKILHIIILTLKIPIVNP